MYMHADHAKVAVEDCNIEVLGSGPLYIEVLHVGRIWPKDKTRNNSMDECLVCGRDYNSMIVKNVGITYEPLHFAECI